MKMDNIIAVTLVTVVVAPTALCILASLALHTRDYIGKLQEEKKEINI